MTDDSDAPAPPPRRQRPRTIRALAIVGLVAFNLALVLGLSILALDTGPGRRFVADRIAALSPSSGLKIHVGRIEGSVYGRMTLRDLRLSDPQGLFLEAPTATLDWRPVGWLSNRLDIRELSSPLVRLHRLPKLRPTERKGPILPGFDIHVGRLALTRLWLGPALGGTAREAKVIGTADIRDGRALVDLAAEVVGGGDRAALKLDAEPDRDRFDLSARLLAPADGIIARIAGLSHPLDVNLDGDGSWTRWDGAFEARLGDTRLAHFDLGMAGGRLTLSGTAHPSDITQGKLQRLTAPAVLVTAAGMLADRRLDASLSLRSSAVTLSANGVVDLAGKGFDGVQVEGQLLRPAALFPNMGGRPVRLAATLSGPLTEPEVDYRLTSPFTSFDETGFQNIRVSGRANLAGRVKTIPILLTASAVTGVGDVAGGLLRNLRVQGPLSIAWPRATGDRLMLTSDRLQGRLGVTLDLITGRFQVDILGGLARYQIPGLGIVDVETRLKLVPAGPRGAFLSGTARAYVRRLDNAFFRSLAGGLPVIDAQLHRGPDRRIVFDTLRLAAPDINLTGRGARRPDGTFEIQGSGTQTRYGPVDLTLDGDISRPTVDLVLAQPGLGVGLAAVAIRLDPNTDGWRYAAHGQSLIGPFVSDGQLITPADQPFVVDIARLDAAGVSTRGRLISREGGFEGELALAGGGVTGRLLLRPQNDVQRIEAHIAANGAHFPGPPPIRINRGQLDGVFLLHPDGPSIEATASGRGLARGGVTLARFDGKASLRAGRGTLTATFAGNRGTAYTLDTRAEVTPARINLNVTGTLDQRPLRLMGPAVISRTADGWALAPTGLSFGGGSATLSGSIGDEAVIDARMQTMPLTILDIINPRLRLAGDASGALHLTLPRRGGTPGGNANLVVKGMSRSGLVLSSRPVDLGIVAQLAGNRAAMRAVVKSEGRLIGRGQALITPISDGDALSFADRLLAAPVAAQLRYNGPADTLWRLTGIETIDLTGPLAVSADATGQLGDPVIRGQVTASGTRLESSLLGAVVEDIKAAGRFDGSRLVFPSFSGTTPGGGGVSGTATFDLAAANGFGIAVDVNAERARLLARDDVKATVTGPMRIRSDGDGGTVSGEVTINQGSYRFGTAAQTQVPRLTVRQINRPAEDEDVVRPVKPWTLAIKAKGSSRLMVTGLGLDSEWRADLDLGGRADQPDIRGSASLVRGTYEFAGRRFDLERGLIRFTGGYPPDPTLDIVAEAKITGLSATIRVGGSGQKPEISFASIPALPEDEVLSRLLFGTSIANLSAPEALQLAAAVASLRGDGGSGFNPLNQVGKAIGVDRLRISPGNEATGERAMLSAGKYIGRRVYVEVGSDGQGNSATQIEVELTRWLSVLSRLSTLGQTSVNVRVSKDY